MAAEGCMDMVIGKLAVQPLSFLPILIINGKEERGEKSDAAGGGIAHAFRSY
jgi:hypothetical protein